MKIIITGGHLSPALAVIGKLREIQGIDIVYVGRISSIEGSREPSQEYSQITAQKIRFIPITAGRLQRSFTRFTLPSLVKIPLGFVQALKIIFRQQPNCILSFGGYVALPICFAAWLLGIPIFTHEQTITRGLANRIIEKFAKKIFISWSDSEALYPKSKAVYTGNPLRNEIFRISDENIPKRIKEEKGLPLLYITGGSQGSESINNLVSEILVELLNHYRVIHQFGQSKISQEKINRKLTSLNQEQKKRYFATPFVDVKSIGWVLKNADLVLGRSGANTVSELLFRKKRCLLIPLPWAAEEEQEKNAKILVRAGLGKILYQSTLTPKLLLKEIYSAMVKCKQFPVKELQGEGKNTAVEKIVSIILSEVTTKNHDR